MLTIVIPKQSLWDEANEQFLNLDRDYKLSLEHSLVSLSKWEEITHKPFISKEQKTREETVEYIRCMTLTKNIPTEVYDFITNENIYQVNNYIQDSRTATKVKSRLGPGGSRGEGVTSELIYYWMITLQIPVEFEKWHLNRLLTLIEVCNAKNQPSKKMSNSEIQARNSALNAQRRARLHSRG